MQNSDTSLEVVMANFNHAKTLPEAVAAINRQTTKPQTIHIVDDCSSDDSREVLLALKKKYTNLNVLFNEVNIGAVATYEKGLSVVNSKYVYFAAADDSIFPELFSQSIRLLSKHENAAFSCSSAIVVDLETNQKSMRPIIQPRIVNSFMNPLSVEREFRDNDNWILTGTTVFLTELIRKEGSFVAELGAFADSMLARKLAFKHGCIFTPYIGLRWNVSMHGYSRGAFSDADDFQKMKNNVYAYLKSEKAFPQWYQEKFVNRMEFMFLRLKLKGSQNSVLSSKETRSTKEKHYRVVHQIFNLLKYFFSLKPFSLRRYLLQTIIYKTGTCAAQGKTRRK